MGNREYILNSFTGFCLYNHGIIIYMTISPKTTWFRPHICPPRGLLCVDMWVWMKYRFLLKTAEAETLHNTSPGFSVSPRFFQSAKIAMDKHKCLFAVKSFGLQWLCGCCSSGSLFSSTAGMHTDFKYSKSVLQFTVLIFACAWEQVTSSAGEPVKGEMIT